MCGRFEIHSEIEIIARLYNAGFEQWITDFKPSYNVAPTDSVVIIINDGNRHLITAKWGLIPSWSKDPKMGFKTINARAETVTEKPAFRDAFRKSRCLVIADGFYEWKTVGRLKKPMLIRLKSKKPMAFAGLYSVWTSPDGKKINTCTIIVTNANELIAPIHDRMPVILNAKDQEIWLNPSNHDADTLTPLLRSYPAEELELYEVSSKVNSVKNNDAALILPVQ